MATLSDKDFVGGRTVSEDEFFGVDELASKTKAAMQPKAALLEGLSDAGSTLGKSVLATGDMILGLPGMVGGLALDTGARIRALLEGEGRKIQSQAGQEARNLIPQAFSTPLQSMAQAAGLIREPLGGGVVEHGIDAAAALVDKASRGAMPAEDAKYLLDAFMTLGGAKMTPPMVQVGINKALARGKPKEVPWRNARDSYDYRDEPTPFTIIDSSKKVNEIFKEAKKNRAAERPEYSEDLTPAETWELSDVFQRAKENRALTYPERTGLREGVLLDEPLPPVAEVKIAEADVPSLESALDKVKGGRRFDLTAEELIALKKATQLEEPKIVLSDEQFMSVRPRDPVAEPVDQPPPLTVEAHQKRIGDFWQRQLDSARKKVASGEPLSPAEKIAVKQQGKEKGSIDPELIKYLASLSTLAVAGGFFATEGWKAYQNWKDRQDKEGVPKAPNPNDTPERQRELLKEIEDFEKRMDDWIYGPGKAPKVEPEVPESPRPRPQENGNYLAGLVPLAAGAFGAIKGKGGMWHPEAVTRLAEKLKVPDPEAAWGREGNPQAKVQNEWADRAVRNYLNKHAGTATDPLKDVMVPFGEGVKRWEELTDQAFGKAAEPERVPGVRPGEDVWNLEHASAGPIAASTEAVKSYLSHVGDYLRQNVPLEKLGQYDLVRAVQETVKWDKELAKNMEKKRLAEKEASPIFKEYPDGMYWQQLTKPGQFARESDVMGHSVRGYEPPSAKGNLSDYALGDNSKQGYGAHSDWIPESGDSGHPSYGVGGWDAIKSGDAKIYSLRDKEGRSHVTVEVASNPAIKAEGPIWSEFAAQRRTGGEPSFETWIKQAHPELVQADIKQIKGKQNRAPDAKYLPYVQDFVKGGKWGEVEDLGNAGLRDTIQDRELLTNGAISATNPARRESFEKRFGNDRYVSEKDFQDWYSNPQRGSVDPELLAKAGLVTAGGALGAYLNDDNKLVGALTGAAAGLIGPRLFSADKGLDYALGILSTRLGNIDPSLRKAVRDFDMHEMTNVSENIKTAQPFLRSVDALPKEERATVERALLNNNPRSLEPYFQRNPEMRKDYEAVRGMLDGFKDKLQALNRFGEGLTDYFPRLVKDVDGLLEALDVPTRKGLHALLLKEEAGMVKKEQRSLTDVERSIIIDNYLKSTDRTSSRPGFARNRGVEEITPELQKFYETPRDSLMRYIGAATFDIEMAKFFGQDLKNVKRGGRAFTDVDSSIGAVVDRQIREGRMSADQANLLRQLLKARFVEGEQAPHPGMQHWRNLNNITLLGQFGSAATQLGDSMATIYHHGLQPTLAAVKNKLTGDAHITPEEFGLANHISEELTSANLSGKALNKLFKISGFSLIDQFAKGLNLEAGFVKNRQLAQTPEGRIKLAQKWEKAYGEEFPQLVEDFKNGRNTELTRSLQWAELADAQPISKSEMPQAYLQNPNGRILYQMKTYMLKQLDVARRDGYQKIREGWENKDPKVAAEGMKNLVAMATMLSLAQVPGDAVKDWLSGRPFDFAKVDYVENFLKNFGINRYSMEKLDKGKWAEVGLDAITPPVKHYQDLTTEKGVKYVPLVGRMIYDREMGGNEDRLIQEAKRAKMKKREEREEANPWLKEERLRKTEERKRRARAKALREAGQ